MNELNINSPNIYNLKIKTNKIYSPYLSKIKKKKKFARVLSAGNINSSNNLKKIDIYKNSTFLPSLNNMNHSTIKIKKNIESKSLPKKNQFKLELEKLYDQNVGYKKIIKKLQSEIDMIKTDLTQKQNILNSLNEKIENVINEKKDKLDFDNIASVKFCNQGKYLLLKKMRNKINETEQNLNNELCENKKLKKDLIFTKSIELEMEQSIINEQKEKIMLLIENSQDLKNKQNEQLFQNKIYNNKLRVQKKLINNFEKKFLELKEEEENLQKEIIKYENILNETNSNVKKIKLKNFSLKSKNIKLNQEKNEFNNKNIYTLEQLEKKLNRAKDEYNYFKLKNFYTEQRLNNIKGNNFDIGQNKTEKQMNLVDHKNIEQKNINNNKNINNVNKRENIYELKKIYEENKDKENELEQNLFLYQEAIQKINKGENTDNNNIEEIKNKILKLISKKTENNSSNNNEANNNKNDLKLNKDFMLSKNNIYYSNSEENDPIKSNKFTNDQFKQFTYVLFKNFEAKKINIEKAKEEIIIPIINYYNNINENKNKNIIKESNIQEKLSFKFSEIVSKLINCNNEKDLKKCKIFFNAIYFDKIIDSKNTDNINNIDLFKKYFLSLFNNIHEYTQKDESIFKRKLNTKYKEQFLKLINSTKEYSQFKRNGNNNDINSNDYISLQEIKNILDNNNININERYIEYLIYYMKQFDDIKSSLFDLKIGKLEEIRNDLNNNENNNNNSNENNSIGNDTDSDKTNESTESIEEISPDEYNRKIDYVLKVVKKLMTEEKKDLRTLFIDSIVKIAMPNTEIITLESFNNELNKRNININHLQLSCINNKYCVNNELHALEISKIENDINNLKENEINNYL